jgi:hypothetical protein
MGMLIQGIITDARNRIGAACRSPARNAATRMHPICWHCGQVARTLPLAARAAVQVCSHLALRAPALL